MGILLIHFYIDAVFFLFFLTRYISIFFSLFLTFNNLSLSHSSLHPYNFFIIIKSAKTLVLLQLLD